MIIYQSGDRVRVLPPFREHFTGTYTVVEVVLNADDTVACILDQDAGGFDPVYLEAAA